MREYSRWGRIEWVDEQGKEIDVKHETEIKSNQSNHWLKWYEEKTGKYIAYEAAAKKFMLEEDYEKKGKCPIMSFLTSESEVDAKINEPQDPESIFYVEEPETKGVPTAMFHGFGDFCLQPGDIQFNEMLRSGTGAAVKCIEVGIPMVGSIIGNFEQIAQESCKKIANDKTFHGEFNVIGLSQGGLLARYIAEECDMPGKVRNVVTLGGPHMGVAAIPHCFEGVACDIVNMVAKKFVYTSLAQNWIAPAGYFRDVNDYAVYEKDSVFLPALNNEHSTSDYAKLRANKFSTINAALLGMFTEDTMIYPKETAWFQGLDKNGKVQALEESDFYKNDNIGLKTLNEAGKIKFDKIEGDHLQFTTTYIKETVIPFLKQ